MKVKPTNRATWRRPGAGKRMAAGSGFFAGFQVERGQQGVVAFRFR